jgi:hypothetical protein
VKKRGFVVAIFGLLGITLVQRAAHAFGSELAVLLIPNDGSLHIDNFTPAYGPLDRYRARPEAWYTLFYVPMAAGWPLVLSMHSRGVLNSIRLSALDAPPSESPRFISNIPTYLLAGSNEHGSRMMTRFALPTQSLAREVFILTELVTANGAPPQDLRVELSTDTARSIAGTRPWWANRDRHGRVTAPPSPLTQQQMLQSPHLIPIYR